MNMHTVRKMIIPEGSVKRIEQDGNVIWRQTRYGYVSLGDSIAAGHTINSDWEEYYGYDSQYESNGNMSTVIVADSYTDLIKRYMVDSYGNDYIYAKSFAKSGDTVEDLMKKLDHAVVQSSIKKADLVTVCIGANDVLQPALLYLEDYINGDMSKMNAVIQSNLSRLNDDSSPYSYNALFNKLHSINPNAQYVFTTIYNPYKYLYLEKSTVGNDYKDGFLGPLMWCIPDFVGQTVANMVRKAFIKAPAVENLFNKINELNVWAEQFVTSLNTVLVNKVNAFNNENFIISDVKSVFDTIPDRIINAPKHYNDLVSVEFTRGFNTEHMDWSRFWANVDWGTILTNIDKVAEEIIGTIINETIVPDVDPHPEWYGHYVMYNVIAESVDWNKLARYKITFDANGGIGTMPTQSIVLMEGDKTFVSINKNTFTTDKVGYHFSGWNTSPNGDGTSYSNGQFIELTGDITLYAQWSNICTVTVSHYFDSPFHGVGDTGPMECYALWINGVEQSDLGAFSNGERVYRLPYGARIGVVAQVKYGADRSYVTWNGEKVAGNSHDARWEFTLTGDTNIWFEWTYWLENIISPQSYWNCYIESL